MPEMTPPVARIAASVRACPSVSTSQPNTVAPSAANTSAAARPIPAAVPLIRHTLASRRPMRARAYRRTSPASALIV